MGTAVADLNIFGKIVYAVLMGTGILGSLYFCIRYTAKAKWWRTIEGGHLFTFSAVICTALIFSLSGRLFHDFNGRAVLGFLVFILIDIVIVWRVVLSEKIWAADRKKKRTQPVARKEEHDFDRD